MSNNGYITINSKLNKKTITVSLHRLMWIVYKGDAPFPLVINHIDGNKLNNKLSNLELVTKSRNKKHAYEIGLQSPCINNTSFSKEEVILLRNKYKNKLITQKDIAIRYNISISTVSRMLNGKRYNYV